MSELLNVQAGRAIKGTKGLTTLFSTKKSRTAKPKVSYGLGGQDESSRAEIYPFRRRGVLKS